MLEKRAAVADMNARKDITIKEIAQLAEVSVATVARTVGNYGSVSEKTKKKVMNVVEKLNFVPNHIAQSMKSKSTKTIGVIVGNIRNTFFGDMLGAIESKLHERGFSIILCNTNEDPKMEIDSLKMLYSKMIDGIIIATCQSANQRLTEHERALYSPDIPIVYIDREIFTINEFCVKTDHFGGAYEATEYLINKGHEKIGVLAGKEISAMCQRIDGYKAALKDHGIAIDEKRIFTGCSCASIHDAITLTKELLSNSPDNTAVFAMNNMFSIGALLALKEMQISVPDQINFIGWDDFYLAPILSPPITVVTQDMERIASVATEKLLQMIETRVNWRDTIAEKRITLKASLIERKSCTSILKSLSE
jgi:LacI family transcriptional regulator